MSHFIKTTKGGKIAIYLSIHLSVGGKDFFSSEIYFSPLVNLHILRAFGSHPTVLCS